MNKQNNDDDDDVVGKMGKLFSRGIFFIGSNLYINTTIRLSLSLQGINWSSKILNLWQWHKE